MRQFRIPDRENSYFTDILTDKKMTYLYLSIRIKSNIYNFKLCRVVYKLKTKYMSTIENYLQL